MIEWPDFLVESIARRRSVLFLGAGVSANSLSRDDRNPPTWESFLAKLIQIKQKKLYDIKDLLSDLLAHQDYLTACEIIINNIGNKEFNELVSDEFRRPGYKPSEIHKQIYALDSRLIITPNVDKIYEQYALAESNSTVVVKSYNDDSIASFLRSNDYLIIKAHGTVDDSDNMIFTQKQYANARNRYSCFYKLLDALVLTHTFIFLGCGVNDPDIKLLFENANFNFYSSRPHYFVTAKDSLHSEVKRIIGSNRNLEFLVYENQSGKHKELLYDLQSLNKFVEIQRKLISDNQTW